MGLVGIKTEETYFDAKIVKIVRKYSDYSIADIKKMVLENDYLLFVDYVDEDGIKKVLALYQDLQNAGISCVLYEHDEVCSKELLENLIGSYEETRRQVEEEMDREAMLEESLLECLPEEVL